MARDTAPTDKRPSIAVKEGNRRRDIDKQIKRCEVVRLFDFVKHSKKLALTPPSLAQLWCPSLFMPSNIQCGNQPSSVEHDPNTRATYSISGQGSCNVNRNEHHNDRNRRQYPISPTHNSIVHNTSRSRPRPGMATIRTRCRSHTTLLRRHLLPPGRFLPSLSRQPMPVAGSHVAGCHRHLILLPPEEHGDSHRILSSGGDLYPLQPRGKFLRRDVWQRPAQRGSRAAAEKGGEGW